MRRAAAALLVLGVGCPWVSQADLDTRFDLDGDGVARPEDCDDGDPGQGRPAVEVCDEVGRDEDCDGRADDEDDDAVGQRPWYLDADGDGRGDIGVRIKACDPPPGFVAGSTDCDDTDPSPDPAVCPAFTVSAGRAGACAVRSDGVLDCEVFAEEDDAEAVEAALASLPAGAGVLDVAVGDTHVCLVTTDEVLRCAGDAPVVAQLPADPAGLPGGGTVGVDAGPWLSVSADGPFTCALALDGAVTCWATGISFRRAPTARRFIEIETGAAHVCGRAADGSVECFGFCQEDGECDAPLVESLSGVVAGDAFSCGFVRDGSSERVRCWGAAPLRDLGPRQIGERTVELSAEGGVLCELSDDRRTTCVSGERAWTSPAADPGLVGIDASTTAVCGLDPTGEPKCFGLDFGPR